MISCAPTLEYGPDGQKRAPRPQFPALGLLDPDALGVGYTHLTVNLHLLREALSFTVNS